MSEHEYNDLVTEAQRVEEALKDFISTVAHFLFRLFSTTETTT